MKKVFFVLLLLLSSITASAIIVDISFGEGIQSVASSVVVSAGTAKPDTKYWVSDLNEVSSDPAAAFAIAEATVDGNLSYSEASHSGDCSWEFTVGSRSGLSPASLSGLSVSDGEKVFVNVKPNSSAVSRCRLDFDLNVVAV